MTYLGDGVYAKREGECVVLATSDGLSTTNRIVLEPDVLERFSEFLEPTTNKPKEN
jgi:hypothetical protein